MVPLPTTWFINVRPSMVPGTFVIESMFRLIHPVTYRHFRKIRCATLFANHILCDSCHIKIDLDISKYRTTIRIRKLFGLCSFIFFEKSFSDKFVITSSYCKSLKNELSIGDKCRSMCVSTVPFFNETADAFDQMRQHPRGCFETNKPLDVIRIQLLWFCF